MRLIVYEDHKAPIASVNVWYHVGSKNEKRGKSGFAHLFEHLMFNGSEHYNFDYFKALESIGATDLNGTTDNDRTNYFQNVPPAALDRVLWLESDRMGQGENEPYGRVFEMMVQASFSQGLKLIMAPQTQSS